MRQSGWLSQECSIPTRIGLEGIHRPEIRDAVVGPKGFTAPVCQMDFRVRGKFLCCMRSPDGQEFWNGGEHHEIVPHEKIVSSMYFSDSKGNKVEPAHYGIEHEAIDGAYDVITFEDLGNGQTKLTLIGNDPWRAQKRAVNSRPGLRHSIKLRPLLQSWRKRTKKLKCRRSASSTSKIAALRLA